MVCSVGLVEVGGLEAEVQGHRLLGGDDRARDGQGNQDLVLPARTLKEASQLRYLLQEGSLLLMLRKVSATPVMTLGLN